MQAKIGRLAQETIIQETTIDYEGAVAEWSKAQQLWEKINEYQKDPRFAPRPVEPNKKSLKPATFDSKRERQGFTNVLKPCNYKSESEGLFSSLHLADLWIHAGKTFTAVAGGVK